MRNNENHHSDTQPEKFPTGPKPSNALNSPREDVALNRGSSSRLGVHSEVGRLRKVLVSASGLAHERLTPANCEELLFDDVLWVEKAREDHHAFVTSMREGEVDVLELHDLLAATLAVPVAKKWLLELKITANHVGYGLVDDLRAYLEPLGHRQLADILIGGLSTAELPSDFRSNYLTMMQEAKGAPNYLLRPLPNTVFTRDTSSWIYGGVGCCVNFGQRS